MALAQLSSTHKKTRKRISSEVSVKLEINGDQTKDSHVTKKRKVVKVEESTKNTQLNKKNFNKENKESKKRNLKISEIQKNIKNSYSVVKAENNVLNNDNKLEKRSKKKLKKVTAEVEKQPSTKLIKKKNVEHDKKENVASEQLDNTFLNKAENNTLNSENKLEKRSKKKLKKVTAEVEKQPSTKLIKKKNVEHDKKENVASEQLNNTFLNKAENNTSNSENKLEKRSKKKLKKVTAEVEKQPSTKSIKKKNLEHDKKENVASEQSDNTFLIKMGLTEKKLSTSVQALIDVDKNTDKKKNLFTEDKPAILLSVICIKIPEVSTHQLRMILPHSLVTKDDEVALFVKDLKRGRRRDYDPTVEYFQNLLKERGCTRIKEVIPMNRVKTEFDQYELKTKLFNSYDFFLTDGRISGHLAHLLGQKFSRKRKLPTSVRMDRKNLKNEINIALRKTSLQLHRFGNNHIVQVGSMKMDVDKIVDNIQGVCQQLKKYYPGGWKNIRSLWIKTPSSLSIPIYITLRSKNKVPVPKVKPKRPKAYRDVGGELSTLYNNENVIVSPDGTVKINPSEKEIKVEKVET